MKPVKLLCIVFVFVSLTACKKTDDEKVPVADFTFSKPEYLANENIELTNASTNAESIRWTLPDGTTSRSNTITYPTQIGSASYTLNFKLDAISKSGIKTDFIAKKILVKQPDGKLILYTSKYNEAEGYLTVGEESKGLVTLKGTDSEPECGNIGFHNYDVPAGVVSIKFVSALNGYTNNFNVWGYIRISVLRSGYFNLPELSTNMLLCYSNG